MSEKLRFFDPQLKENPEQELFKEPDWLIHLRQLDGQMRVRNLNNCCYYQTQFSAAMLMNCVMLFCISIVFIR